MKVILGIAAVAASIGSASADEFKPPPTRDGLWESHTTQTQQGKTVFDMSLKICQSKEFSKSTQSISEETRKKNECTSVVSQPSANTFSEESRCAKGPNAGAVSKVTYTFQGDTAYHMEMRTNSGKSESVMVMDMKYLSSCPAGMKPGDSINAVQK